MKKVMIGSIILFVGAIWITTILYFAVTHSVSSYFTPPGRLLSTVIFYDLVIPFYLSIIFLIVGIVILGLEYFKKEH